MRNIEEVLVDEGSKTRLQYLGASKLSRQPEDVRVYALLCLEVIVQPIGVYLQRILVATHTSQQYCLGLKETWKLIVSLWRSANEPGEPTTFRWYKPKQSVRLISLRCIDESQ